ncbi:MAG: hypothetical protein GY946_18030 [bacterium]|nr:hypothetical protein [bacterium]
MTIDLSYQAKSNRQVDIIMKFTNSSIEESEKITSEVTIQGFNIVEGGLFWDGFVPPRQPQSHTVHLVVAEGFDAARAEITVRRAADSTVLVAESLQLTVGADGRVQAGP